MALQQSIDLALDANIGAGGLPQAALDDALGLVGEAMKRLAEDDASGRLPLLHMPRTTDDLASIREAAAFLRDDATDVVVPRHRRIEPRRADAGAAEGLCGAGRRALHREPARPLPRQSRPHHLRPHPAQAAALLDQVRVDLEIRRHGRDPDADHRGAHAPWRRPVCARTPTTCSSAFPSRAGTAVKNALRDLLEPEGVRFLEHHTGIGGRYSVLTNVGLLPAAVLGLDVRGHPAGRGGCL